MTNIRNMLYDFVATLRFIQMVLSMTMIVLFAPFSTAHEQPLTSDVNVKFSSQRCGDHIHFFFNDSTGKNIDPARFQSIRIMTNFSGMWKALTEENFTEKDKMKGFGYPTGCGLAKLEVKVVYEDKEMTLIIKRISMDDGEVYLYSIPFSEGTYMFDLEYDYVKNCEGFDGLYHYECIVSGKRIKKVTPEKSK